MVILSIDSSGAACSAALYRGGEIAACLLVNNGNTHSQQLMPLAAQTLELCGCGLDQVDAFACVTGPGSFTGVRIGVCAVRAMAMAQQKPVIAVSALEALAVLPFDGAVCAMIDARHDQAYCAAFVSGRPVLEQQARGVADFVHQAHALDLPCLFVGDGALAYRAQICAVFGDQARFALAHLNQVCASGAAVFAAAHPERMTAHDALLPQYLRASQAEREYAGRAAHG